MIYTSYFAAMRKMTDEQKKKCISIAQFTPKGIKNVRMTTLAPSKDTLMRYKQDHDEEAFAKAYLAQINSENKKEIGELLQGNILLCYEKPSDFCHRHILAEWFRSHGYECEELAI